MIRNLICIVALWCVYLSAYAVVAPDFGQNNPLNPAPAAAAPAPAAPAAAAAPSVAGPSSGVVNPSGLPSATDVLANITAQLPFLTRLVTALAYIFGMYLIIAGIIKCKHFGELRTQMSYEHSVKGPIIMLSVGAALLYLPSAVQVGLNTFWTSPNPYGYPLPQQNDAWSQVVYACQLLIQFVGVIAFIRGLVMMSHLASDRGHQASFKQAVLHIIGGILCINIYQFVQVIMVTLQIQSLT